MLRGSPLTTTVLVSVGAEVNPTQERVCYLLTQFRVGAWGSVVPE
jgi:hypothetical protein